MSDTPPKSPVLPIHPPGVPPDPKPFVVPENKSGGCIGCMVQAIVFILMVGCFVGGVYILFL